MHSQWQRQISHGLILSHPLTQNLFVNMFFGSYSLKFYFVVRFFSLSLCYALFGETREKGTTLFVKKEIPTEGFHLSFYRKKKDYLPVK